MPISLLAAGAAALLVLVFLAGTIFGRLVGGALGHAGIFGIKPWTAAPGASRRSPLLRRTSAEGRRCDAECLLMSSVHNAAFGFS